MHTIALHLSLDFTDVVRFLLLALFAPAAIADIFNLGRLVRRWYRRRKACAHG
ncbi:hypothetical protein KE423_003909 [Salmonella enterica]|nr:hypothetical protein [Salmonella enterica]